LREPISSGFHVDKIPSPVRCFQQSHGVVRDASELAIFSGLHRTAMSFSVRDGITPELSRKAARLRDKKPVLEAMGLQLVAVTQRSFYTPSLRAKPWPVAKQPNKPRPHQLLRLESNLMKSIRIVGITTDSVAVGSDRVYAAHQQFGSAKSSGRGSGVPARPFFPFASPDSPMTPTAREKIRNVALAKIRSLLGE
jgi:phage gpG-like protein